VRQDPVVRHRIQHGAGGPGVALFRRDVLGPFETVPGSVGGHDPTRLERWCQEVKDEETEVPGEDKEADERARDLAEEAHVHLIGIGWLGLGEWAVISESVEEERDFISSHRMRQNRS